LAGLQESPPHVSHDQQMAATVLETGCVGSDDRLVHAVRRRLSGAAALCGAGAIEKMLPGRFDPESPDSCPACAEASRSA
jgi:hypothetical protein